MVWNIDSRSEHFSAARCLLLSHQRFIIPRARLSWQNEAFPCCPPQCSNFPVVFPLQLHAFTTQTSVLPFPPPRAVVWQTQCSGVAVIHHPHRSKWQTASWCCCYCLILSLPPGWMEDVCLSGAVEVIVRGGWGCLEWINVKKKRWCYAVPITMIDTFRLPQRLGTTKSCVNGQTWLRGD